MSGSIGGDRILRSQVQPTYDRYIQEVLKGFPGYRQSTTTGSYNAGTKKDHGDIDLAVYIQSNKEVKDVKKDFKKYLDSLPDEVTVPFRTGRRQGEKSQIYGAIVTCQVPIEGEKDKYVQIDNIVVTTAENMRFQKSFLDLDAAKQALIMGLVRVLPIRDDVLKKFELENLPELPKNQEYEFVLSPAGLSFRQVTLTSDRRESSRIELWRSTNWDNVLYLLKGYDLSKDFETLLQQVDKDIKDKRSRERIVGIMKSMINVGVGEVGTPKGEAKQKAIDMTEKILLENRMVGLAEFINEGLKKDLIDIITNMQDDDDMIGRLYRIASSKISEEQKKYLIDYIKERGLARFLSNILKTLGNNGDIANFCNYITSSQDGFHIYDLKEYGDIYDDVLNLKTTSGENIISAPSISDIGSLVVRGVGQFEYLTRLLIKNYSPSTKGDINDNGVEVEMKYGGGRLQGQSDNIDYKDCLKKALGDNFQPLLVGTKEKVVPFWMDRIDMNGRNQTILEMYNIYVNQYSGKIDKDVPSDVLSTLSNVTLDKKTLPDVIGALTLYGYWSRHGFDIFLSINKDTHKYIKMTECSFSNIYKEFANKKLKVITYATQGLGLRIDNK